MLYTYTGRIANTILSIPTYLLQLAENVPGFISSIHARPKISSISYVGVCGSLARSEEKIIHLAPLGGGFWGSITVVWVEKKFSSAVTMEEDLAVV